MANLQDQHDQPVQALRNRIAFILMLKYTLAAVAAWAFAWGVAVIALRYAMLIDRWPLAWGAVGVVPMLAVALMFARRRVPSLKHVRALIDRSACSGGLLMAKEETDLGDWGDKVQLAEVPVRWDGKRMWLYCLAGLIFVSVGFILPDRLIANIRHQPLDVADTVEQLQEQVDVLKEEELIPEEQAGTLENELKQIEKDASGKDPLKTLEALDHIEELLTNKADEAAEEALKTTNQLNKTEALAKTLDEAKNFLPEQTMTQAMSDLAAMAGKAMKAGQFPEGSLDAKTMKALKDLLSSDPLAKKSLESLKEALKKLGPDALAKVDEVGNVTLFDIDPKGKYEQIAKGKLTVAKAVQNKDLKKIYQADPTKISPMEAEQLDVFDKVYRLQNEKTLEVYRLLDDETTDLKQFKASKEKLALVAEGQAKVFYQYDAKQSKKANECANGQNMQLDPDALRQLAKACQAGKAGMNGRMMKLVKVRLVQRGKLKQCQKAGQCDTAALIAFLKENGGQCDGATLAALAGSCNKSGAGNNPGAGGLGRGRSDAEMAWGPKTDETGFKFKARSLDPANLDLAKSIKVGEGTSTPTVDTEAVGSAGGALAGAKADGGSAVKHQVLPRHRAAVQRYFSHEQSP